MSEFCVRFFEMRDADALARLFHASVHRATTAYYTEAQRRAWSPEPPDATAFGERLARGTTLVAESDDGALAGFMQLCDDGYLDLAFTHPDHAGRGVASSLQARIETLARQRGLMRLETHASDVARPFFERRGFIMVAEDWVERRGQRLRRWLMRKNLGEKT